MFLEFNFSRSPADRVHKTFATLQGLIPSHSQSPMVNRMTRNMFLKTNLDLDLDFRLNQFNSLFTLQSFFLSLLKQTEVIICPKIKSKHTFYHTFPDQFGKIHDLLNSFPYLAQKERVS